MRRPERVVNVHLSELRELLAEGGIVLLLALVEAEVLHDEHLSVLQRGCLGERVVARDVRRERDGLAEHLGQVQGGGAQRELLLEPLPARAAAVAHEHHARTVADELLDGRERRADAGVVGYDAVLYGNVEVNAHQHALSPGVELVDRLDCCHVHSSKTKEKAQAFACAFPMSLKA